MRRLTKGSSAQCIDGSGQSGNRRIGRSFATRGASSDSKGGGAPAGRRATAVGVLSTVALLTLVVGVALSLGATKKVDSFVGSPTGSAGSTGGLFSTPRGIGLNQTGTGGAAAGDFYVVDATNNRIQQFTAAGAFVRAWGNDVSTASANEMQAVTVNATAGQFTLTFGADTTGDLAFNAGTATIQTALNGLPSISTGGGSVTVSGGPGDAGASTPYLVNFSGGPLAGTNVAELTPGPGTTPLSGGTGGGADEAKVSTFAGGGAVTTSFEICEVAATCKAGLAAGTGGAMNGPQGLAVNQATGHVYVTDQGQLRVTEFDATGNFVRLWGQDVVSTGPHDNATGFEVCSAGDVCKAGTSASTGGAFKSTFVGHPAVAPAGSPNAGDVYVGDPGNLRVQEFTAAGVFVRAWGKDVDATEAGEGFEVCSVASGHTCKAGVASPDLGAFGSPFDGSSSATRIAVDSTGKVYAIDNGNRRIESFTASGGSPALFYAAAGAQFTSQAESSPAEIAIGAGNSVFVSQPCPNTITTTEVVCPGSINSENRLKEFNSAGVLQSTSFAASGFNTLNGLAVNPANDKVYFSTSGEGATTGGQRVWTADNDGALPAPVATISDPTEITAHTVSFAGTVIPNGPTGIPTSYHFEYSKNGITWTRVAADVNLGDGSSPVNVPTVAAQGEATGLEANTLYRVRIVASKAFGAAAGVSPEKTFLTDSPAPEIQTLLPQTHTDTGARLTGLLNAGNLPTAYHFEYGKTVAYGSSAPVPDGSFKDGLVHLILEDIDGLEPETTYHYRLVATNAEGTSKGQDVSFTTRAAGVANVPGRAYEMLTPPLKVSPSASKFGIFANPGVPSLDGERMIWGVTIFPLNGEAAFPYGGDIIEMNRTPGGWTHKTLLTTKPPAYDISYGAKGAEWRGASGDLRVMQWTSTAALLPFTGTLPAQAAPRFMYTQRTGTGIGGFTQWNPGVIPGGASRDWAAFNDDGSWMARWGEYRGVLGSNAGQDSSVSQLLGLPGGQTLYQQGNAPTGAIELVNGCTGTVADGNATQIPSRVGTGAATTDLIGVQSCQKDIGALAEGTGTRATASPILTGVTTGSGAFAVGQVISGPGISPGAVITAVGAGTLTMSINAQCPGSTGTATRGSTTSPVLTAVITTCGAFQVGQTITGSGIPAGTTITAMTSDTLTLSANPTATGSGTLTVAGPTAGPITARTRSIVSFRGAVLGGSLPSNTAPGASGGFADTAMSADGRRVFFEAPDPSASGVPTTICPNTAGTTGVLTNCPPQLYVRQFDEDHQNPVVRWISRSAIPNQQIGLIGSGTGFGGAARDGSVVYFRSNAPLTADDPNGAGVAPPAGGVTTGSASASSIDLFRYELPASGDPANGALTRISGGPAGTADSNGGNARYVSDDGRRAYFVTNSPIAGADSTAPTGGVTTPGGTPTGTARDLYVFDDTKAGAERYKFIAQLPSTDTCATTSQPQGASLGILAGKLVRTPEWKCFRGTKNGNVVTFISSARLTADDQDNAEDIYLYDLRSDELTRVSTPLEGAGSYECQSVASNKAQILCNGDFGARHYGGFDDDMTRGWGGDRQNNLAEDADGNVSVYFQSRSRLVPEDTNGDHWDVYQWKEGKLSLISPGNAPHDSYFSGNGFDGRNVFFQTSQQIDPTDVSAADFDIYDARIGGGIPYTPPPTPCDVLALKCEGSAIPAPAVGTPSSSDFKGPGNAKPTGDKPKCGKGKVRKHGKCVKKPKKPSKGSKRTANTKQGSGK